MNAKLTLRMDEMLIMQAKVEAKKRGKSVSQMVSEFITALGTTKTTKNPLPPVTSSLSGIIKDRQTTDAAYKKHLMEKYG